MPSVLPVVAPVLLIQGPAASPQAPGPRVRSAAGRTLDTLDARHARPPTAEVSPLRFLDAFGTEQPELRMEGATKPCAIQDTCRQLTCASLGCNRRV